MIVKNEASVITRCLNSVRNLIDYWVIVDTGSTDGTQEIVRQTMDGIPGELHERPWVNFAANRTEALHLAKSHGDYTLIIDADDMMVVDSGFCIPSLAADSYTVRIDFGSVVYYRPQIIRSMLDWEWKGVVHEFLSCTESKTQETLAGIRLHINSDGARRHDPDTYKKDANLLEEALKTELDPFMRSRYFFYLAQSYRDCGKLEESIKNYMERVKLGYWNEEVYLSYLYSGRMSLQLGHPYQEALELFSKATSSCLSRIEARFEASLLHNKLGKHQEALAVLAPALYAPLPPNGLFVESWIYEWGLEDQYATMCYWTGRYKESLDHCISLLSRLNPTDANHVRITQNARFALQHLHEAPANPKVLVALETCSQAKYKQRAAMCVDSWGKSLPENFDLKICTGEALGVSDDYQALCDKTQAIVRYALDKGYDWLLIIDDDGYIRTDKLTIPVGHDYAGWVFPSTEKVPWAYCSGGSYWLSRRALEIVAKADMNITHQVGALEDVWVGHSLMKQRVYPFHLQDFVVHNDHITANRYYPFNPDWQVMIQITDMGKVIREEQERVQPSVQKLATVYTPYGDTIHPDVVKYQKEVVERFLPDFCDFKQYHPEKWTSHADALTECMNSNPYPVTVFLDIDCIPLKQGALGSLVLSALGGALAGAVQRANHIDNGGHLYVGPFCAAFSNKAYKELGSPSFNETSRGDCLEELTYVWEAANQPVKLMWPSRVTNPMWDLRDGKKFGQGTTYDSQFYHAFEARGDGMSRQLFIDKCKSTLLRASLEEDI